MAEKYDLGTIQVSASHLSSGEVTPNTAWAPVDTIKQYTNCFIIDEAKQRILLGYKKRGFGMGLYNGFGGKIEPGETSAAGALRELQEEACISSPLEHAGTLLFTSESSPMLHHIEVYRGFEWTGTITETEEMRPQWFSTKSASDNGAIEDLPIPFDEMWSDDRYWFPYLLSKQNFVGRVDFGLATKEDDLNSAPLVKWWFGEVVEDVGGGGV